MPADEEPIFPAPVIYEGRDDPMPALPVPLSSCEWTEGNCSYELIEHNDEPGRFSLFRLGENYIYLMADDLRG
jgi:hypothetical protein